MRSPKNAAAELLLRVDADAEAKSKPFADSSVVQFLGEVSEVGDQPQIRAVASALIAAALLRADRRMLRAGTRILLAHESATMIKDFVKRRIDRTRPRSAAAPEDRELRKGQNTAKEETSFPSGHSTGATAAAVAFAQEYPEHRALAFAGAAAVSAAQVPRCAHYPTDVGAGMLIGAVAGAASNWIYDKLFASNLEVNR
jgi:membrane-associated phospholipid phosphatase